MAGGPRAEENDKQKAPWGASLGRERGGVLSHTQSQVCPGETLSVATPGTWRLYVSRVTGFSVFVWSVIPGVYVGFSLLARARGRRGGGGEPYPGSWKEITAGERNTFFHPFPVACGSLSGCRERYRMNVHKTYLAQQTAGVLHNDPCLSPSPPSAPANHRLALKVGWNSTFSFSLLSLSVQRRGQKGGPVRTLVS